MTAEQCELEMVHGPSAGERYALTGVNLTIGRDALSDIVIQDPEVSRQHALLIYDLAGHYLIQDLGSTNGTFVNDERLGARPVRLRPSSSISMGGSVTLLFHQESAHEQDSSSDQSSAEKEEGVGAEQAEGEVSQAEPFRSGPLIEVEETARRNSATGGGGDANGAGAGRGGRRGVTDPFRALSRHRSGPLTKPYSGRGAASSLLLWQHSDFPPVSWRRLAAENGRARTVTRRRALGEFTPRRHHRLRCPR